MFKVTHVLLLIWVMGKKNMLMILAVLEGFTSSFLNRNHESSSMMFIILSIYILQMFLKASFCSEECSMLSKISKIRLWMHVCMSIDTGSIYMAIWTTLPVWETFKISMWFVIHKWLAKTVWQNGISFNITTVSHSRATYGMKFY